MQPGASEFYCKGTSQVTDLSSSCSLLNVITLFISYYKAFPYLTSLSVGYKAMLFSLISSSSFSLHFKNVSCNMILYALLQSVVTTCGRYHTTANRIF